MNFTLELPTNYRSREILAFHARDPQHLTERVEGNEIEKGFVLDGIAIALHISLHETQAHCRVDPDNSLPDNSRKAIRDIARNLLGLAIDPLPFETAVKEDALFGPLIARQSGLRIPQAATPFEALTWAIVGQQINLAFAIALRRTFIQLAGRQHSGGLWCYPEAADVARIDPEDPRWHKFSRAKAATLLRVAALAECGKLPLDEMRNWSDKAIYAALLAVKGIGPWTANYTLLRGFGCADCSLHGDVGIREALRRSGGLKLPGAEIEVLLERYKPHRSLAAAHLWASLKTPNCDS